MFDCDKLIKYGFIFDNNGYVFSKEILDGDFTVRVMVNGDISYKVYDNNFLEEFILIGDGTFSNNIRSICDCLIDDICSKCKEKTQVDFIKEYIFNKYGDVIECLWKKCPRDGIFRNKNNNKWYALVMEVSLNKLGIDSNKKEFILNVMHDNTIVDNKKIFLGYHMNKKNWITIILDGRLDNDFIYNLIDDSYNICQKKH